MSPPGKFPKSKKFVIFGIEDFAEIAYEYFTWDSAYEVVAFSSIRGMTSEKYGALRYAQTKVLTHGLIHNELKRPQSAVPVASLRRPELFASPPKWL